MQTDFVYDDVSRFVHLCSSRASRSTGKEIDAESGLDYFGARYYGSNVGRFMSPDWAAKAEPAPYAKLDYPQSLNLYAYVGNNPLGMVDADGHAPFSWGGFQNCAGNEGGGACQSIEERRAAAQAQQQSQTQPANANVNVVLSAGFPPQANHTEDNGAFFEVQWDALKLDSKGAVIPHYNPQTGLYSSTPAGEIKLIENQGAGFTSKYSSSGDHGSTVDTLIAGHAPLQQRWTVGGQPVRVVIGGTASKPVLAWTVQVTMSPRGPVYSAAP